MANLESLNYESISDMSQDEAIELLRQIRLSRRTPVKKPKTTKIVIHGITGKIGIGNMSYGPIVDPPAMLTVMLRNKGA